MFPLPEQLSSAAKAQWETQLQLFSTLSHQAFDGAEKIIALNLDASKAAIARTADTAQHLLAAHDAREFLSYSTSQAQPGIESVLAYSRQLFGIASSTQAQLLEAAKARLATASPVVPTTVAPVHTAAQVEVEAIVDVPALVPVSTPEPEPAPVAVLAPVAEPAPAPAAPAPLPLAASLPIAASAPAAIAPAPAKVATALKATVKVPPVPVASKPAIKQGGPSKAAIQPAPKGKRK